MATSPLPAGPFSVRVNRPVAIGSADQVMIEEDAFRFGSATDTGSIEWIFTLPFFEIAELRYKPTGGRVSGTLEDGAELEFRIGQGLASEEAMRAVEALFHPEPEPKDSPDHSKVSEIVEAPQEPTPRRLLVRSTQIVSDEELAEAIRSLEKRFEAAAQYGVESQARRFAELTAAADLDVRWNGRGLDAVWRRTQKPIFFLTWNDRGVKGGLGVDHGGDEFNRWSKMRAEEAFDWDPIRSSSRGTRTPGMGYTRKMDAAGTNHTTDLFLDWLQEFLAKHSIPSREAEAVWKREDRFAYRGCGVVVLALSSIIWLGIVTFLFGLFPEGFFPWGEPIGWAITGLLFLIVPVTAIVKGVAARREILDYNREHPDAKHFGTGTAWTAIIVAALIVAYVLTLFLLWVT